MKKTYINPELEVVKLNAKYQLMAGSLSRSNEDAPITGDEYDSLSREFDWDE